MIFSAQKRTRTAVASITAADSELDETLDNLEGADNYAAWIYEQVEPHLGKQVLEVGAGNGTFTGLLSTSSARAVATDVSGRCAANLRSRFADDPRVTLLHGSIAAATDLPVLDAAVLSNVLEHIDDDDGALRELSAALKPGDRLIVWVPAFALGPHSSEAAATAAAVPPLRGDPGNSKATHAAWSGLRTK